MAAAPADNADGARCRSPRRRLGFCVLVLRERIRRQRPGCPPHVRALVGLRQARGPRRLALTARFAARLRSCATTMLGMGEETTYRCKKSSRAPIHCFRLFLSMEKATRACASFKVRNG